LTTAVVAAKKGNPLLIVEIFMTPVKITIQSVAVGQAGQKQKEQLKFVASGSLQEKNGVYYVRYEESAVTGMQGTKTTLKWTTDALTVIRHGTYEHRQEHRLGLAYQSEYKTPYFIIPLRSVTRELQIKGTGTNWQLHLGYDMVMADTPNGTITLDICIEEEQSSGY